MGESKDSWWKKNQFCVYSKTIEYNVKPAHWVGHSQLRYLDIDDLFKGTQKCDEK